MVSTLEFKFLEYFFHFPDFELHLQAIPRIKKRYLVTPHIFLILKISNVNKVCGICFHNCLILDCHHY